MCVFAALLPVYIYCIYDFFTVLQNNEHFSLNKWCYEINVSLIIYSYTYFLRKHHRHNFITSQYTYVSIAFWIFWEKSTGSCLVSNTWGSNLTLQKIAIPLSKIVKNLTFFSKDWQNCHFFQQNCHWQFCWKKWQFCQSFEKNVKFLTIVWQSNGNFLEGQVPTLR